MTKFARMILKCALLALAADSAYASVDRSGESSDATSTTRYQKAIAPYIAAATSTYPDAKKRFLAGLPRKEAFYVSARVSRVIGLYALAIVKVTSIDESEKLIHGRVQNDVGEHTGYTEGDDISFPESEVIDWKISHPNGAEEGDVVGKYFASLGPDINVNGLLADQRDADLGKLENSKTVESALDNTFLRLFDDKNLKVEVLPSSIAPAIKVWPSLYRKYRDLTPDALIAELNKRAAAIAKTDKVTVEPSSFQDKSLIMVSAYVVLGKTMCYLRSTNISISILTGKGIWTGLPGAFGLGVG